MPIAQTPKSPPDPKPTKARPPLPETPPRTASTPGSSRSARKNAKPSPASTPDSWPKIQPDTFVLHELFLQYVHACWNLHRLRGIEADYFLQTANPFADETLATQLEAIARHRTRFERVKTSVFKQIQDQLTNRAIARESDNVPLSSSPLANLTVLHRAFKPTDGEAPGFPSIDSILSGIGKNKQNQAA